MNPLFMVKTKCTDKQHSGECASGPRILEMDDSIHFTSLSAHVVNAFCVLLFSQFHWFP